MGALKYENLVSLDCYHFFCCLCRLVPRLVLGFVYNNWSVFMSCLLFLCLFDVWQEPVAEAKVRCELEAASGGQEDGSFSR